MGKYSHFLESSSGLPEIIQKDQTNKEVLIRVEEIGTLNWLQHRGSV